MKRLLCAFFLFLPFESDAMEHKESLTKIKEHYIKTKDLRSILVNNAVKVLAMPESTEKKSCIVELRGNMEKFLRRTKRGIKRCAPIQIKYVIRYNAEAAIIATIIKNHLG